MDQEDTQNCFSTAFVDECESDTTSLQQSLDHMSERGWQLVSVLWLPKRIHGHEELNAQYTLIFEREDQVDAARRPS